MNRQKAVYIFPAKNGGILSAPMDKDEARRRRGKRNKHRIDIYNASGARVARHYDYGGAAYLLKWYGGIYTPEKYIIKIF